jgi:ubiquinone/menaquinone biosynthesis C-methylase UbiE
MCRVLEPEIMDDLEQVLAYAKADFSTSNQRFVDGLLAGYSTNMHSVLDIGCGPADIPIRLARVMPTIRITAVDASATMIEVAKKAVNEAGCESRVKLARAHLPGLPFDSKSFDTVLSNSLLHHLADPAPFWREVMHLGRNNATIFVMDLFRPDSPERALEIVEAAAADEHPLLKKDFYNSLLAAFTLREVREQLDAAGLTTLSAEIVSERHWLVHGKL